MNGPFIHSRTAIASAYGKKQLTGRGEREIAISNQCRRLIANAIVHSNSAMLSELRLRYETENNQKGLALLKKIRQLYDDTSTSKVINFLE